MIKSNALTKPINVYYQCALKKDYEKILAMYNKTNDNRQGKLEDDFVNITNLKNELFDLKMDSQLALVSQPSRSFSVKDSVLKYLDVGEGVIVNTLVSLKQPVNDVFSKMQPEALKNVQELLQDFNKKLNEEAKRSVSGLRQDNASVAAARSRNTVRNGLTELRAFLEKFYFQPAVSEGNPELMKKLADLESRVQSTGGSIVDIASVVSNASELRIEVLRSTRQLLDDKLKKSLKLSPLCPDDEASKAFRDLFTRDIDSAAGRLSSAVRNSNAAAASDIAQLRSKVRPSDLPTEEEITKLRSDIEDLETDVEVLRRDRELQQIGVYGMRTVVGTSISEEKRKTALVKEKREALKKKEALRERNKTSLEAIPNSRRYESALTAMANSVQNYYDEVTRVVSKVKEKIICADGVSEELVALVGLFTLRLNFFMGDVVSRTELTDQLENDRMYLEKTGFEGDIVKVDRVMSRVDGFVQQTLAEIERFHANLFIEISQPVDKLKVLLSSTSGVIYAFKLAKAAVSVASSYASQKLFDGLVKRVTGGEGSGSRDLRWFVAVYAAFDVLFSLAILAVSWIVLRSTTDDYGDILKDIAVDFSVTTLMVCASLVWISDIVQDTRYFGYRDEPERAIRILRNLASTLGVVHGVLPYFFLVGPFYTGRAAVRAALPKSSRTPYVFTETVREGDSDS